MSSNPRESSFGLDKQGLDGFGQCFWNLPAEKLVEHALRNNEGELAEGGVFAARTGAHTGRSPKDKFIVDDPSVHESIDWGNVNRPISQDHFEGLLAKAKAYIKGRNLYIQDLYAGADPAHRMNVRVITEQAWHNMFARNMFIRPDAKALADMTPDFTVLQLPGLEADPATDGTNSETFIIVDFKSRLVLVGGSYYAGEIKKSIFGVMNYILPDRGVMPMHCSANVGSNGEAAVFFGLSGTGKTTLSADASRTLLGDDEHGWGPDGLFNFEGGCYAKVIKLRREAEPEIYDASTRFGALYENVVLDPQTGIPDFDDGSLTENTRSSYPIEFVANASSTGMSGHPANVIMLTADAFGVLPPVSKLTPEQAMYHFLSGYTAKVAGTERGLKEPQATFSTCFGGPFMPRHPSVYASMLKDLIARNNVNCWLVNTGWSGGDYHSGARIDLRYTRAMIRSILDGTLANTETRTETSFGLHLPVACADVPTEILDPRTAWADTSAYDAAAQKVAALFEANFAQFAPFVNPNVVDAGIRKAA